MRSSSWAAASRAPRRPSSVPTPIRPSPGYHFTLGFWGANGITREDGFTTPDAAEAEVKRLSMRQTLHRFVLADASKADRVSRVTFADFEDATLVTSALPASSALLGCENVMVVDA